MKKSLFIIIALVLVFPITGTYAKSYLNVVTTLPDYASFAEVIGGDRVSVKSIVRGDQDAHFIRPKPSFINCLACQMCPRSNTSISGLTLACLIIFA